MLLSWPHQFRYVCGGEHRGVGEYFNSSLTDINEKKKSSQDSDFLYHSYPKEDLSLVQKDSLTSILIDLSAKRKKKQEERQNKNAVFNIAFILLPS